MLDACQCLELCFSLGYRSLVFFEEAFASNSKMAARGRGRGGRIAAAPAEPARAEVPCDLPAAFFATLPLANWPLFLSPEAPNVCLTCRHEPHFHRFEAHQAQAAGAVAAARVVADPLIRVGPAPALPLTPGEVLRSLLSDWRACVVLSEDRPRWDKLFCDLSDLLFDPFSRTLLLHLEAVGNSATTRKWSLRDGLDDEAIDRVNMALRSARDLGITIINVLRLEWRHRWKSSTTPLMLIDGEHELPVALFVAEQILKASPLSVPGARLPPSVVLRDPQFPHWWGILAATVPIETFISTLREFFSEHVTAWSARAENKGLVVSATAFRAAKVRRAADEAHVAATAAVFARSPSHRDSRSPAARPNLRSRLQAAHANTADHQDFRPAAPQDSAHRPSPSVRGRGGRGRGSRRPGRGRFSGAGRAWAPPDSSTRNDSSAAATPSVP